MLAVHPEVQSSLIAVVVIAILATGVARLFFKSWSGPLLIGVNLGVIGCAYMLFFFRDPERLTPNEPLHVYAGADGTMMAVKKVYEPKHLKTDCIRFSIFLSLMDVHVNRAPLPGTVSFADYFPGARYFTFQEKSSDHNQRSEIVIESEHTRCLVNQIVGPIARRVVYWVKPGKRYPAGYRIGMMKFGSRLDIYIPEADIDRITVQEKQKVVAGVTVLAVLKNKTPVPAEPAPAEAPAVSPAEEAPAAP